MKTQTKLQIGVGALMIGLLVVALSDDQEVFIESKESKAMDGSPVFNRIKWFSFKDKDVWMMNQSHHGPEGMGPQSWDRLAIVVDKTVSPKRARFYQLEPGPLQWKEGLKEKPFKVSCYMCHSNGPRAIRPNYDSALSPISVRERIRISYWNFRMKLYGRVLPHPMHDQKNHLSGPPFRFHSSYENEALQVKSCSKCHNESGFLARGELTRQQIPTMKFMLESGEMPPPGFSLSQEDQRELEKFLKGF